MEQPREVNYAATSDRSGHSTPPTESSNTNTGTRSASETRQDIANYVIEHADGLPNIPGVENFVEVHGRLTKQIAEAREWQRRMAKAKQEYEPLEQRVDECRQTLKDAETELAKLHRPLGEAAFKAFLASDIDEQPIFADRLAIHKRVQELQQECDRLSPGSDAGFVQQAKAKAQQLAIIGKIKLEELKFGGLHTKIGREIVEGELDVSIRCDAAAQLLGQLKHQRDGITKCSADLKEATTASTEAGKRLAATVGLARIESTRDLAAAITLCDQDIRKHESDLEAATRGLVDALQQVNANALPNSLVTLLGGLTNAGEHDFAGRAEEYKRKGIETAASAKKYWSGLEHRTKIMVSVAAVSAAVVVLFFWSQVSHSTSTPLDFIASSTQYEADEAGVTTSNASTDGDAVRGDRTSNNVELPAKEEIHVLDVAEVLSLEGYPTSQLDIPHAVGEYFSQYILYGSWENAKRGERGYTKAWPENQSFLIRNLSVHMPQGSDLDLKGLPIVTERFWLRIYGWTKSGSPQSDVIRKVSVNNANNADFWFLTKNGTLMQCLGDDVDLVLRNNGILYLADYYSSEIILYLWSKSDVAKEVKRNPDDFVVDIVVRYARSSPPSEWGYYRLDALREHDWDCSFLRNWNYSGVAPAMAAPYYFQIDRRMADVTQADLVAVVLKKRDGTVIDIAKTNMLGGKLVMPSSTKTPTETAAAAKTPDAATVKKHMTPAHVALGDPMTNSIGMVLVPIPAGEFQMGSLDSDRAAEDNEKPQHLVKITKPFYLSVNEVTQQQYEKVMGVRKSNSGQRPQAFLKEGPDNAATYVSDDDAVEFCGKLSEQEDVEYRLPTEAQWEYACRAGTTTTYSFGDDVSKLGQYAWYSSNSSSYDGLVGQKLPNSWGLYDMHGNVSEWCRDWYAPYGSGKAARDPGGPASGISRVLRGGSFGNESRYVRSACRHRDRTCKKYCVSRGN